MPSLRERPISEAQLPRIPLLGNRVNRLRWRRRTSLAGIMLFNINDGFKSEEGFYVGLGAYPVGSALRHRRRGAVGVIRPVGATEGRPRRRTTLQRGGHHGLLRRHDR